MHGRTHNTLTLKAPSGCKSAGRLIRAHRDPSRLLVATLCFAPLTLKRAALYTVTRKHWLRGSPDCGAKTKTTSTSNCSQPHTKKPQPCAMYLSIASASSRRTLVDNASKLINSFSPQWVFLWRKHFLYNKESFYIIKNHNFIVYFWLLM